MQRLDDPSCDPTEDLPRVLLENYLLLSAAVENQNLGRLQDMLQYQQKAHHNLLEIVQHIADAPAVAMTTSQQPAALQQPHRHSEQQFQEPDDPYMQEHGEAIDPAAVAGVPDRGSEAVLQHYAAAQEHGPQHQHRQQLQQQGPPLAVVQLQDHGPQHHQQQQQLQQQGTPPPHQQAVPFWLPNVNQPVGQLLQQLGLAQFGPLLEQQHVDLAALQLMDESHMRALGLPLGAIVKIKAALSIQQQAREQ